jgi:hypothetical protein
MVIGVGVLLIVLGVWNAIDGLTALFAGGFVVAVADAERVVALEVAAWGWVLLALGVVEVIAGIALFIGARWAGVVAVLVAGFNGIVQLAFLGAYPVGAVLIMVVVAVVIWTVVRHGDAGPLGEQPWGCRGLHLRLAPICDGQVGVPVQATLRLPDSWVAFARVIAQEPRRGWPGPLRWVSPSRLRSRSVGAPASSRPLRSSASSRTDERAMRARDASTPV